MRLCHLHQLKLSYHTALRNLLKAYPFQELTDGSWSLLIICFFIVSFLGLLESCSICGPQTRDQKTEAVIC